MCLASWHVSLLCYYVTLPHCDHDHVSGIFGSDSYKGQVVPSWPFPKMAHKTLKGWGNEWSYCGFCNVVMDMDRNPNPLQVLFHQNINKNN